MPRVFLAVPASPERLAFDEVSIEMQESRGFALGWESGAAGRA